MPVFASITEFDASSSQDASNSKDMHGCGLGLEGRKTPVDKLYYRDVTAHYTTRRPSLSSTK
jgi:hypothetical protein